MSETCFDRRHVYAVAFTDGSVKVGCTYRPDSRVQELQRKFGLVAVAVHMLHVGSAGFAVERRLIAALAKTCQRRSREVFVGIGLDQVKDVMSRAAAAEA